MAFKKGQSGNPGGRRPGTTRAAELRESVKKDLPAIRRKLIELAKGGDLGAIRILFDRVYPPLRPRQERMAIKLSGTPTEQSEQVTAALGQGKVSPDEAQALMATIAAQVRIAESDDIAKRLQALEEQANADD